MLKILKILFILLFILQLKPANSNVQNAPCPAYNALFEKNYNLLMNSLPDECREDIIFNILFDAYSIKFETIDYEYADALNRLNNSESKECCHEIQKYIKNLKEIALEEYNLFLDDLSFELCGEEGLESKIVRKNRKRFKKELKKARLL